MATLWIDVDDTLIRWLGKFPETDVMHPYGAGAEKWEVNENIVKFIDDFLSFNPDGNLIVWSGGGKDYAEIWARRVLTEYPYMVYSKFNRSPESGDIYLDDSPFDSFKKWTIHPKTLESETYESLFPLH